MPLNRMINLKRFELKAFHLWLSFFVFHFFTVVLCYNLQEKKLSEDNVKDLTADLQVLNLV